MLPHVNQNNLQCSTSNFFPSMTEDRLIALQSPYNMQFNSNLHPSAGAFGTPEYHKKKQSHSVISYPTKQFSNVHAQSGMPLTQLENLDFSQQDRQHMTSMGLRVPLLFSAVKPNCKTRKAQSAVGLGEKQPSNLLNFSHGPYNFPKENLAPSMLNEANADNGFCADKREAWNGCFNQIHNSYPTHYGNQNNLNYFTLMSTGKQRDQGISNRMDGSITHNNFCFLHWLATMSNSFRIGLAIATLFSPIVMISLPKWPGAFDGFLQMGEEDCGSFCQTKLITICLKNMVLGFIFWLLFHWKGDVASSIGGTACHDENSNNDNNNKMFSAPQSAFSQNIYSPTQPEAMIAKPTRAHGQQYNCLMEYSNTSIPARKQLCCYFSINSFLMYISTVLLLLAWFYYIVVLLHKRGIRYNDILIYVDSVLLDTLLLMFCISMITRVKQLCKSNADSTVNMQPEVSKLDIDHTFDGAVQPSNFTFNSFSNIHTNTANVTTATTIMGPTQNTVPSTTIATTSTTTTTDVGAVASPSRRITLQQYMEERLFVKVLRSPDGAYEHYAIPPNVKTVREAAEFVIHQYLKDFEHYNSSLDVALQKKNRPYVCHPPTSYSYAAATTTPSSTKAKFTTDSSNNSMFSKAKGNGAFTSSNDPLLNADLRLHTKRHAVQKMKKNLPQTVCKEKQSLIPSLSSAFRFDAVNSPIKTNKTYSAGQKNNLPYSNMDSTGSSIATVRKNLLSKSTANFVGNFSVTDTLFSVFPQNISNSHFPSQQLKAEKASECMGSSWTACDVRPFATDRAASTSDSKTINDVDGANNAMNRSQISIITAGASERYYEECQFEVRLAKRRLRLILAAESAFQLIQRRSATTVSYEIDAVEAAQIIFSTLLNPLQKYLRLTRQQARFTMESVLRHLSLSLIYELSARAFVETYLALGRVYEQPGSGISGVNYFSSSLLHCYAQKRMSSTTPSDTSDNRRHRHQLLDVLQCKRTQNQHQRWILQCHSPGSSALNQQSMFNLKSIDYNISLFCSLQQFPQIHLSEQQICWEQCWFVLNDPHMSQQC